MNWLTMILIGAMMGGLAYVFVRSGARLGIVPNAAAGAAGALTGAYCAATAASGLPGAPVSWMIAALSAALSLAFVRWVASPLPAAPGPRRR